MHSELSIQCSVFRSDWSLHQTEGQTVLDCDCEEPADPQETGGPAVTTPRCQCCHLTPSLTEKNRGMKKYQAVIRLNSSSTTSYSDMSTLNLTNLDESRPELDLTYSGQSVNTYYTLDSRRLASRHQKNQQER